VDSKCHCSVTVCGWTEVRARTVTAAAVINPGWSRQRRHLYSVSTTNPALPTANQSSCSRNQPPSPGEAVAAWNDPVSPIIRWKFISDAVLYRQPDFNQANCTRMDDENWSKVQETVVVTCEWAIDTAPRSSWMIGWRAGGESLCNAPGVEAS